MSDWTSGYVADIGYTFGYYSELNPLRIRLAFLYAGLAFPEVGTACELGFGQGLGTNLHAAASGIEWYGTDFNPSQASFAQELAKVSGSGAKLYDDAFADFANRSDLPDFDYIGLHGIWSWVSDENRHVIADFLRRKLKVGGVLYISYNTFPGWATFAPVRHLMTQHAEIIGADGHGIVSKINGALEFTEKLLAASPIYTLANPHIVARLEKIKEQNRHYLAHEFFNRDWHPVHFATMAEWLEPAKVSYACSAHYLDHIEFMNLSADQQAILKEIPDPMFRESVRDFMTNQRFRRDYWVKGARKLNNLERTEALRAQKVMLVAPRLDVTLKVAGALGEATMNESVYGPILDLLTDHKPRSLSQIEQAMKDKGVSFAQLVQATMVLVGSGTLVPVQDDAVIAQAKKACAGLNAHLIRKARGCPDITYLASPVTGGGVMVDRLQQLMLLALSQGVKEPANWAQFIGEVLASQGHKIAKGGQAVETPEEIASELRSQALSFSEKQLPLLQAHQIV